MAERDQHREHYTVDEAAERLQLTPGRIRQMLRDGHLDGTPPGEPGSGRTGWRVDPRSVEDRAARQRQSRRHDQPRPDTAGSPELVDELRDRVRSLERQLDQEREANRENRRIIAGLIERVPELMPASTPEPRESRESDGETAGKGDVSPEPQTSPQRKSWWRRVVGG